MSFISISLVAANENCVASRVEDMRGSASDVYDPIPHFYSRFLDFSWRLYGSTEGLCVLFVSDDSESQLVGAWYAKMLNWFWTHLTPGLHG